MADLKKMPIPPVKAIAPMKVIAGPSGKNSPKGAVISGGTGKGKGGGKKLGPKRPSFIFGGGFTK